MCPGYVGKYRSRHLSPLYNRIEQTHEDSFVGGPGPHRYIRSHIMGDVLTLELEQKAAAVRDQLAAAVQEYGRVVYSNSLGAEAMVLTDIIWSHVPEIDI